MANKKTRNTSKTTYGNNGKNAVNVLTTNNEVVSIGPRQEAEVEGGLDTDNPVVKAMLDSGQLTEGGLDVKEQRSRTANGEADPELELLRQENEGLKEENEELKAKVATLESQVAGGGE